MLNSECTYYWRYLLFRMHKTQTLFFNELNICIMTFNKDKGILNSALGPINRFDNMMDKDILMNLCFMHAQSSLKTTNWNNSYETDIEFVTPSYMIVIQDEYGQHYLSILFKAWLIWISQIMIFCEKKGQDLDDYLCCNLSRDDRMPAGMKLQILQLIQTLYKMIKQLFERIPVSPRDIYRLFYLCNANIQLFKELIYDKCGIKYKTIILKRNIVGEWDKMVILVLNEFCSKEITKIIIQYASGTVDDWQLMKYTCIDWDWWIFMTEPCSQCHDY